MKKHIFIFLLLAGLNKSMLRAQLADGSIAPDFTLTDLNGTTHNLYTYLNQGKTVYVDLFACHCGTCWAYHNTQELETFNNQHGPAGTLSQDAIVISIEYDANNGFNEFHGISGVTQGDWVTGTTYFICNPENGLRTQIITDYAVTYFPLVYGVCSDKTIYGLGTPTASQLYNFAGSCTASSIANQINPKEFIVVLSANQIYIKSKNKPCFSFYLYDLSGKLILKQEFRNQTEEILPIDNLAKGVYYYQIDNGGVITNGKLVK